MAPASRRVFWGDLTICGLNWRFLAVLDRRTENRSGTAFAFMASRIFQVSISH